MLDPLPIWDFLNLKSARSPSLFEMPEPMDQGLFPVGKGAQGSSIFLIGTSKLREASPEPVLPTFCQDGSGNEAMVRAMAVAAAADKLYNSESYMNRNRHSIKSVKPNPIVQNRSLGFDRLLNSKPEELLGFSRRLFRNTSTPDTGMSEHPPSPYARFGFLI
jgi:hypothetical protein